MEQLRIGAVVVTHNRKEMLIDCIDSLINQGELLNKILIFDNASTDGTKQYFENYKGSNKVEYQYSNVNGGGAFGFYNGIKKLFDEKFNYIWIMDDDVIVKENALKELVDSYYYLKNEKEKVSFLASMVYDTNGLPTNVPYIDTKIESNGYSNWNKYIKNSIVSINNATFVSLLIPKEAIEKCGLPCKDYFIWGDDTEYTQRLVKYYGTAYLVGTSEVIHRRTNNKQIFILNEESKDRIKMYYYHYRNNVINSIFYCQSKAVTFARIIRNMIIPFKHLFKKNGLYKIIISIKGTFAGLIQYSIFKKAIINQINQDSKL